MKKRLFLILSVVAITVATGLVFHSCELTDCATCKQVAIQADGTETTLATVVACDDELTAKEDEAPVTINGVTTKWVCE